MPALVDQTRTAFKADVDSERLSAQAFVREELLSTLYALQQERIATIDAMHSERLATTAQIRGEREAAMEVLRSQEIAVMNEFEAFSEKSIQDLDTRGRSLINYFFLRAARTDAANAGLVLSSGMGGTAALCRRASSSVRKVTRPCC